MSFSPLLCSAPSRPVAAYANSRLPTPPSLTPTPTTTTLQIFGPPTSFLATLESWLVTFGPIASYRPGPEGSNWFVVEYESAVSASYALRRHGEVLAGRYMIGFRVADGMSASLSMVGNGQLSANSGGGSGSGRRGENGTNSPPPPQHELGMIPRHPNGYGAGTPIKVHSTQIIKSKSANTGLSLIHI